MQEKVDVVPSDVMMALVLLKHEQEDRMSYITREVKAVSRDGHSVSSGKSSSPVTPAPWMNIDLASHYMKFAAGSYGWPMYVFKSPSAGFGLAKVLSRSRLVFYL